MMKTVEIHFHSSSANYKSIKMQLRSLIRVFLVVFVIVLQTNVMI